MNTPNRAGTTVISVVVPLYNEEDNVVPLMERLKQVFDRLECGWEVVFALDPSPDRTREKILDLVNQGYPIRLVTFSRRIGKPLSLLAGLDHCLGDACVVIDADLQDPPELIEAMVEKWREGYKVVVAQRISRKGENPLYLQAARFFYRLLDRISEVKIPRDAGDFRLLDARVVREICRFRERHGFLRGITAAVGFPVAVVPFDRDPRHTGKAQISFRGAINIALDGIVPFSRVPVRMVFWFGLALSLAGAGIGLVWLLLGLVRGFLEQWPIVLLCLLMVLFTGIITASIGILGEYMVRTYEESRERPLYIIDTIEEGSTLARRISRAE
ncbi:MAG: glycosyltransferase [Desulfomonile tiedjei]|nr:glycosyltransferase [Desulfomonile tiedjei]